MLTSGKCARSCTPVRHKPTIAAGFAAKRFPSRMYFLTMSAERWPVWDIITRSEARLLPLRSPVPLSTNAQRSARGQARLPSLSEEAPVPK
jgi:hypothetical protein